MKGRVVQGYSLGLCSMPGHLPQYSNVLDGFLAPQSV